MRAAWRAGAGRLARLCGPGWRSINGALAPRSPGSALKPFAYLLALESGFTAASVLPDLPREYATPTGLYEPRNYSGQFYYLIPLREALGNSLNVSAVHLLNQIGGAEPFAEALQRAGLTTLTEEPEHYGLGLVIGNAEVRLLELANAYACLARLGAWKPYRLDRAGADPPPTQIFDRDAAWLVADILADNAARARAFSAWSALRMGFPVACKTGTSTDFRDSWAFGYTPEFTAGVWIGNFDGTPMQDVASIRGPAPVLREVIGELRARFGTGWFERPAGIRRAAVDPVLGLRVPADHPRAAGEWFLPGTEPRLAKTEDDDDPNGRPLLPYEYRRWLAGTDNWLGASAIARTEPDHAAPLEIRNPLPGTVIFLDPDLPGSGSAFPLEANRAVRWASDTLEINGDLATVKPGRHAITATDAQTGEVSETWIEVRGAR
ncbi:MAG: penicillin-binding transpeptidase domain-containing protein [Verrucomicrobiales bacterium]